MIRLTIGVVVLVSVAAGAMLMAGPWSANDVDEGSVGPQAAPVAQVEPPPTLTTDDTAEDMVASEVPEAYRRWADVPLTDRPALSMEYMHTRRDILSHRADGPFRYQMMSDDELEDLARAGHLLAKSVLGSRLEETDPHRAVDLFMEAAIGGVIDNLPDSGRTLARLANDEDDAEIRDAVLQEAYTRLIATVMFGLGIYDSWIRANRTRHEEVGIGQNLCASAASLVDRINAERAAQNQRPIDVMFNEAEISGIMQANHGICG